MARICRANHLPCLALALLLLLLGALGACGTPCGNLWKRVERCGRSEQPEPGSPSPRNADVSAEAHSAFATICRKADKSRVKSCLKLRDCKKLLRCAGRIAK